MSRYVAVIEGLSGVRRVLARHGGESSEARMARIFRSTAAGTDAAQAHVGTFAPAVRARLRYAVIEEERLRAILDFEESSCQSL